MATFITTVVRTSYPTCTGRLSECMICQHVSIACWHTATVCMLANETSPGIQVVHNKSSIYSKSYIYNEQVDVLLLMAKTNSIFTWVSNNLYVTINYNIASITGKWVSLYNISLHHNMSLHFKTN
jgi:hypothetical protein